MCSIYVEREKIRRKRTKTETDKGKERNEKKGQKSTMSKREKERNEKKNRDRKRKRKRGTFFKISKNIFLLVQCSSISSRELYICFINKENWIFLFFVKFSLHLFAGNLKNVKVSTFCLY